MLMKTGIRLQAGARRQSRYVTYYWTMERHHDDGEVRFFGGRLRDASPRDHQFRYASICFPDHQECHLARHSPMRANITIVSALLLFA